ncbi:hypothetical protein TcBrA4_0138860 [Trypanosoma cruzi]|nr:hypothetical protein TcBrA4_0138860 [Trypanosoma cruzi]
MRWQPSLSWIVEKLNALCDANVVISLDTRQLHAMCAREGITHNTGARQKTARGCPLLMKADDGSPIHSTTSHRPAQTSHRNTDTSSDISNCPTQSTRRAKGLICQRRSTVLRRIADIPALGQLYEGSERGRSRDAGAAKVGAWNVPSGVIHKLLLHARTADERGELCGFFDGNRCGAIDPTAVRQDAAVHVANGLNPAGDGGFGVTKLAAR